MVSGLLGTVASAVFLPEVISVGASASMFGLLGAYWADVLLNHCAVGNLRDAGIGGLLIATLPNLLIGITPWVDQFMHLGGLVAGLLLGCVLCAQRQLHVPVVSRLYPAMSATRAHALVRHSGGLCCRPARVRFALWLRTQATGAQSTLTALRHLRGLSTAQRALFLSSTALLSGLVALSVSATLHAGMQSLFRSCVVCGAVNCIELDWFSARPWWSCCLSALPGECSLAFLPASNRTLIAAYCNVTGVAPFTASCDTSSANCVWPQDAADSSLMCQRLCMDCGSF